MPDILVEVKGDWLGHWLGHRKPDFLDAIHPALVEVLRVPPETSSCVSSNIRATISSSQGGMSEKFTRTEIEMFAGRSIDAKRALYREIVQSLMPFGVPPNDIKIALIEVPKENVGFRGGKAACDVELGYTILVREVSRPTVRRPHKLICRRIDIREG
jgi:phenylpyruvate tautomerase PptA (4-oxalocrotonate tautomerase family)